MFRKIWRKLYLRNVAANDNHERLDLLYALPDPWDMHSAREQTRFVRTNQIIEARVGTVGTILEIGCGEGHQSEYFARLCRQLYAIDVSARALSRARARVPGAHFATASLASLPWTPPGGRFDLAVACEMLYYVDDIAATVARMSSLGRACLVTFFAPAARIVAPHVEAIPGVERGWIFYEDDPWLYAFWQPESP